MKTSIACGVLLLLIQGLSCVNAQPSWEEPWCPEGWESFDNFCYFIYAERDRGFDWDSAEFNCELSYFGNNPHLASIQYEDEGDFIYSLVQSSVSDTMGTWFGLKQSGQVFTNADGTTQSYWNFADGQPDLQDSCIELASPSVDSSGKWYDDDCNGIKHHVCKMLKLAPEDPCPDGGEPWGDSCYTFHQAKQTLADARTTCSDETKNLISIETEEENGYVAGKLPTQHDKNWLGLSKNNQTGEWTWDDPGASFVYNNWLDGYPHDNSGCAVANKVGEWWTHTAEECSTMESYVVCKGALGGAASVTVGYFVITAALVLSKIF